MLIHTQTEELTEVITVMSDYLHEKLIGHSGTELAVRLATSYRCATLHNAMVFIALDAIKNETDLMVWALEWYPSNGARLKLCAGCTNENCF